MKEIETIDLEYDLICEFIKLRNDLGLTQKEMANKSGVVREMITTIENRKKHPQKEFQGIPSLENVTSNID